MTTKATKNWVRATRLATTTVAAAALASPGAAHAGTYNVSACSDGSQAVPVSSQWVSTAGNVASVADSCSSGGTYRVSAPANTLSASSNWDAAGVLFSAPASAPNLKITSAYIVAAISPKDGDSNSFGDYGFSADGVVRGDLGTIPAGSWGGLALTPQRADIPGDGTRNLLYRVANYGQAQYGGPVVWLGRATITFNDPTAPAGVTPETSGLLAGGAQAGTRTLTITPRDSDSGIFDTWIQESGNTIAYKRTPGCQFVRPIVCDQSPTESFAIDTTKLPEGNQQLSVVTDDASGNLKTFSLPAINVDNIPAPTIKPAAPNTGDASNPNVPRADGDAAVNAQITAFDGVWTDPKAVLSRVWQVSATGDAPWTAIAGATATTLRPDASLAGKWVRLAVTARNSEGATTAYSAGRRVDQSSSGSLTLVPKTTPSTTDGGASAGGVTSSASASGGGAGGPAVVDGGGGHLVPASKRTSTVVAYRQVVHVRGTLLDGSGKPIAGGQIQVQQAVAGGARQTIATITSDAKGRYVFTPDARSNRVVTLVYGKSTQTLSVGVKAGVDVRLKDRHIASRGTGVLVGRVQFDGLPRGGVHVTIYAQSRGRTFPIATKRTNSRGKFMFMYRYRLISHGVVPIRVHVQATPGMAARASDSAIVRQLIG